jgi:hypothetical protein
LELGGKMTFSEPVLLLMGDISTLGEFVFIFFLDKTSDFWGFLLPYFETKIRQIARYFYTILQKVATSNEGCLDF